MNRLGTNVLVLAVVLLVVSTACGGAESVTPTAGETVTATDPTQAVPTDTPVPEPTATESAATATPLPPTATVTQVAAEEPAAQQVLALTSPAFSDGDDIPSLYTCDGDNISPPLAWDGAPADTESFALICDDPDAPNGTWVHWVIYGIPAESRELAEAVPADALLAEGAAQGQNSWPRTGYGGPCPPSGTHRYFFKLYALDSVLDLEPGAADKAALLAAMEGHVIAETELMGRYARK